MKRATQKVMQFQFSGITYLTPSGEKRIDMRISELFATNVERCKRWHPGGIEEWSPLEWAGAMAGEAGEAANAAKKLKRMENSLLSINEPSRSFDSLAIARGKVADEVADTIIYGLLLMARVGIEDPEAIIRRVFNAKSAEYGFPERLGDPSI